MAPAGAKGQGQRKSGTVRLHAIAVARTMVAIDVIHEHIGKLVNSSVQLHLIAADHPPDLGDVGLKFELTGLQLALPGLQMLDLGIEGINPSA